MRTAVLTLVLFLAFTSGASAGVRELRRDFRERIEAAFSQPDPGARAGAMKKLFYRGDLDENTGALLDRTVQQLLKSGHGQIDFAPLPEDVELVHVLNGYEYSPNLVPLGYVVFSDPGAPAGNNTTILYGKHPEEERYYFPATVRKLVNPAAPGDKLLQILAVGIGSPPVAFSGWCDIALSNGETKRVTLQDNGVGNQTRILRGQKITGCELRRESGRGTLSLRLLEGQKEIFMKRIDASADTIRYQY
jgi:hypothetical protein